MSSVQAVPAGPILCCARSRVTGDDDEAVWARSVPNGPVAGTRDDAWQCQCWPAPCAEPHARSQSSRNSVTRCEPSQNGISFEAPQRHNAMESAARISVPSARSTRTGPCSTNGPLRRSLIRSGGGSASSESSMLATYTDRHVVTTELQCLMPPTRTYTLSSTWVPHGAAALRQLLKRKGISLGHVAISTRDYNSVPHGTHRITTSSLPSAGHSRSSR